MFAGHYAVALAARPTISRVGLGTLFVVTQLPDIVMSGLLLLGVEQVRIHPGVAGLEGVEELHVPVSHSMPAALAWAALAGLLAWVLYRRSGPGRFRIAVILAALTASHAALDQLGATLPVLAGTALEGLMLIVGLAIYGPATRARDRVGRFGFPALALVLAGFTAMVAFTPAPPTVPALALSNLAAYAGLAVASGWVDRHRTRRTPSIPSAWKTGRRTSSDEEDRARSHSRDDDLRHASGVVDRT